MTHAIRTHFIAPKKLIDDIDKVVGPRKRTEFFIKAAEEKLQRERLLQATQDMLNLPPGGDVPEWETPESTLKWVNDLRAASDRARSV
jgi:hypothetical protein